MGQMTKRQLAEWDAMKIALRRAEREFMEQLQYAEIEGVGAVLRRQEVKSIREALALVRSAQK